MMMMMIVVMFMTMLMMFIVVRWTLFWALTSCCCADNFDKWLLQTVQTTNLSSKPLLFDPPVIISWKKGLTEKFGVLGNLSGGCHFICAINLAEMCA